MRVVDIAARAPLGDVLVGAIIDLVAGGGGQRRGNGNAQQDKDRTPKAAYCALQERGQKGLHALHHREGDVYFNPRASELSSEGLGLVETSNVLKCFKTLAGVHQLHH